MNARRIFAIAPLLVAAVPVVALAKDCNEIKTEVDAKITAKGVTNYLLEIVDAPQVTEGKIVGTCAGGAKKIVYRRKNPLDPKSPTVEEKPAGT
jgi:hypothetical protein